MTDKQIVLILRESLPKKYSGLLKRTQILRLFQMELANQGYDFTNKEAIIVKHKGEDAFSVTPNFRVNKTLIWMYPDYEAPEDLDFYLYSIGQLLPDLILISVKIGNDLIFIKRGINPDQRKSYEISSR